MLYKAVYQQHQTRYVAQLAYSTMGTMLLLWVNFGWCVPLDDHQTLAPTL
jgi:hypothetical protein